MSCGDGLLVCLLIVDACFFSHVEDSTRCVRSASIPLMPMQISHHQSFKRPIPMPDPNKRYTPGTRYYKLPLQKCHDDVATRAKQKPYGVSVPSLDIPINPPARPFILLPSKSSSLARLTMLFSLACPFAARLLLLPPPVLSRCGCSRRR